MTLLFPCTLIDVEAVTFSNPAIASASSQRKFTEYGGCVIITWSSLVPKEAEVPGILTHVLIRSHHLIVRSHGWILSYPFHT